MVERKSTISVLHFYKASYPESIGGVETFIDNLCKNSRNIEIKNIVLALSRINKSDINMDNYTLYKSRSILKLFSTNFSLSAFKKFSQLNNNVDIIHLHYPNPFADLLLLLCGNKKPIIITYHSDIVKQKYIFKIYKFLMFWVLNSADKIIATSPNYLKTSPVLDKFKNKVRVIPPGINIDNFLNVNKDLVQNYRKQIKEPFFLFIGVLRYYKGLHTALEAIKNTNIKLVICGNNGVEKQIKNLARKLNLKNVKFLGYVTEEEKIALLHSCAAFIFPSNLRTEAFGMSLLEAAACSKPLISCEIGTGTSFINKNNETGLVIKPNSPGELRKAMRFIIKNPNLAKEMGKRAKERVEKVFRIEKQISSYLEVYKEVIETKK